MKGDAFGRVLALAMVALPFASGANCRSPLADLVPELPTLAERRDGDPYSKALAKHLATEADRELYRHYVEVTAVDPAVRAVAKALGEGRAVDPLRRPITAFVDDPFVTLSGSGSVEVGLLGGEMKMLRADTLQPELNVLFPPEMNDQLVFTFSLPFEVDVPPYRSSPAKRVRLTVNGETNLNLKMLLGNAREGRYLLANYEALNVPFKHGHLVVVPVDPAKPARIYFRTEADARRYAEKKLALPDESHPEAARWHLGQSARTLVDKLQYAFIQLARAKSQDRRWEFTDTSRRHLQTWVTHLKKTSPESLPDLAAGLAWRTEMQGGAEEAEEILQSFGLARSAVNR